MRARTLLAGTTLALLVAVWSTPAALAADPGPGGGDSSPPSSSSTEPSADNNTTTKSTEPSTPEPAPAPVAPAPLAPAPVAPVVPIPVEPTAALSLSKNEAKPGESFGINALCNVSGGALTATRDVVFAGSGGGKLADNAGPGDITITLKCVSGGKSAEASSILKVLPLDVPGPAGGARLSVPAELYPGDRFTADAHCVLGTGTLDAPGVRFNGVTGKVVDDAHEGKVTVTLHCPNGDTATDSFYVKRKYEGKPWLDLDPSSGKRGDQVDVRAYCPDGGGGRLESDGLDDIRLQRDGDRLRGETHVERNANYGRTSARLVCDNGDRDSARFDVERDEHDRFLDLDPGHGHGGDEVDVRVHCDRHLDKLDSDILENLDLDRDGDHYWRFHGTTHVRKDADYGEHTIRIKCGDDWLEQDFFVQHDGDSSDSGGQTGLYPKGGVETGGGPADDTPFATIALGLTGMLGAGLAGAGAIVEQRGARR